MKETLLYILEKIVDHPKDLVIDEVKLDETSFQYTIHANPEDMGKIIGREGKIIQAIRNVLKIIAVKEGKHVRIEVA